MKSRPGRFGSDPCFSSRTQSPTFRSSTRIAPVVTGGGAASVVVSLGDGRAGMVVVVVDVVIDAGLLSEEAAAVMTISTSTAIKLTAYDTISPTSARSRPAW